MNEDRLETSMRRIEGAIDRVGDHLQKDPSEASLTAADQAKSAEAIRRLEARVAHGREQTARADTKAQIVAAGAAAVAAATIASGVLTELSLVVAIPAWAAVAAMVAAVATLGAVLWPRAPRAYRPNVDLILGHARRDDDAYAADLASEAMAIEQIRDTKFRFLRTALCLLAATAFFAVLAASTAVF